MTRRVKRVMYKDQENGVRKIDYPADHDVNKVADTVQVTDEEDIVIAVYNWRYVISISDEWVY